MNETTIERLTKAGRKLGLTGYAGQNGCLYYWAHGSSCTDLGATNYADALHALECEAAAREECEKAEEQYLNDLVKEHAPWESLGKTIPYSREVESRLRNVSELPHGTGARYLLAIRGEGTDLVAQEWKRTAPSVLKPNAVLIDFAKPRGPGSGNYGHEGREDGSAGVLSQH